MDRKGILSFLAITFGLTYAIELPALFSGLQLTGLTSSAATYLFLPVMFVPALAALLTVKFITREGFKVLRLHFGPWKEYLAIGLLIPALFALVYAINWLLGFAQPDWNLEAFKSLFAAAGQEAPAMPDTRLVLAGIFLGSLTGGALFNWLFCFGEDLGWRGYLLPKLLPLGKTRAYLLMGLIWSVWHWPLVWMGFTYNQPGSVLALACFTLLTTALGIYLNELTLRTNSSIIAGWAHGVFNTQKVGLWFLLFPQVTPYLGGYAGLIGLAAWFGLAWWEARRSQKAAAPVALSQAAG